ncbi:uncharacterized protein H6S33_000809 [Morchella sextelata]|uniref:uncharacterized protein n=1 Tax=Morchella sextelata TaxID=1174677 RepID=UPI001D04055B|nr:uncharacterized protein H6S33_000809 [Morchella sextelata]KAH0615173.1 hypothetical protein H6S33_000809 [Morchella sextelata]
MSQQASLQSFFTQCSQQGTAPSQIRNTQVPDPTLSGAQEQEFSSTFATTSDYNDPYQPRIDYLYPSIVPQDTHTQTDLNYITVRDAYQTTRVHYAELRVRLTATKVEVSKVSSVNVEYNSP